MGTVHVQSLDQQGWTATFADPDDKCFQLVSPFPG
jgi:hypothetical protein